ncbi:hypothetical protein D1610_06375 [Sphingomonas gilva]|uniref:Uncharacterized protein n=1 Tax=Sphingomonas gilva TaxID=2305907 RepID=A0A396RNZ1_9SPHN|nr:hypothetical protein [Sphingomonas gilva]RHW18109.1 hypothetical protein D1610_06375 [Sphingomonas gilva]
MSEDPVAGRAAGWLVLAASPTFALMALLTATLGGGPADMLCSAAHGASPFGRMALMYALMSVFHAAPWLRRLSTRRARTRQAPCGLSPP